MFRRAVSQLKPGQVLAKAIYSERGAVWTTGELHTRDTANPFPSRGYAVPPR